MSILITSYHTLSARLDTKTFSFSNFKINSQVSIFLSHLITTPCHSLSLFLTPYPLSWKQNHFHLTTPKLIPRPQFFITSCHAMSLLITPYHTLFPRLEKKAFLFPNFKISSQASIFLSHLTTPCHSLSHLIPPYPLGWKQNQFHLATLKLVSRSKFLHHILSCLATPYHTLSHCIP